MTMKLNCWEFKNCGREKGGLMVELLGQCPVATAMKYDGHNGGIGAGRVCWMVASSHCGVNEGPSQQGCSCHECDFYHRVVYEEEEKICFRFSKQGTSRPEANPESNPVSLAP